MIVCLVLFVIECMKSLYSGCLVRLPMNLLEIVHDCLTIVNTHFIANIAHDMNQAAPKMCFGISPGQGCFHADNTVRQEKLDLLQTPRSHVLKHFSPNFDVFAGCYAVVDYFFMAIGPDANGNIDGFTLKRFSAQRKIRCVKINAKEPVAKLAFVIGFNLWNHLLGNI